MLGVLCRHIPYISLESVRRGEEQCKIHTHRESLCCSVEDEKQQMEAWMSESPGKTLLLLEDSHKMATLSLSAPQPPPHLRQNSDACNFRSCQHSFRHECGSPTISSTIFQLLTCSELTAGGVHTWLSTGGVEVCVLMESVTYSVSYGCVRSRENTSDPKN